jgi:HK97 family phage major capsid protein
MKHFTPNGAEIELKSGDDENPDSIVTKALDDLTKTVDERIKAVEEKADTTKLTERLDKLEVKVARPKTGDTKDADETAQLEKKAFGNYLRLGNQTPPDELKALTVSSDPQAGYLAPPEMSTEFVRDLVEFSPIRQYASVRTTTASSVKYPKRTGITNAQWEGETEESQESTATFGQLEVDVHKLTTFVDISNELLGDSGGAAEAEVRLALAEDFGKSEAAAFVNGSGVKQPEGLMTNADIDAIINGHATNLNADKLIDLLYDMPAAYRNAPGAAWAMNGTTLATVRKLKNSTTGEYLWQPSIQAGQPETILGKPVIEMVDLPDVADGNFPIVFGDWSAYRIVDRLSMSILSNPYSYAHKDVTRIHATRRVGARVLQAARFRKLKTATS